MGIREQYGEDLNRIFNELNDKVNAAKAAEHEYDHKVTSRLEQIRKDFSAQLIVLMRKLRIAYQVAYEYNGIQEAKDDRCCAYNLVKEVLESQLSLESENQREIKKMYKDHKVQADEMEREKKREYQQMLKEFGLKGN